MSETESLKGRPTSDESPGRDDERERDARAEKPAWGSFDAVGRYQIRSLLGSGGMGLIFTAFDPELARTVALKLIRFEGPVPSSRANARLLREAQALAKLQHPNVVSIYDVGIDDDQVFIAMELIAGQTLGDWLAARPRPWHEIRDVFLEAGRGLAAAHAVGIVHRDFKPSNVIVGADRVVVVDFGLALARRGDLAGEEDSSRGSPSRLELDMTLTGERLGTPRYMAPEQHAGGEVTALADQFAFAVALWTALYGTPPFGGDTREEREKAIARGPAPPPEGTKVPDRLRAALVRALDFEPGKRWPTLSDLLAELMHDPQAARRRLAGRAATVVALLGAGAVAFSLGRTAASGAVCAGADEQVAPLWSDQVRDETRAAFRATGRPYADETFLRVDASLKQRLGEWAHAHRDACEATELRHEQPPELLDARMVCLGRARSEIASLVRLLSKADADALDRAAAAAGTVGAVAGCSDLAALRDLTPPPREPSAALEVERLRAEVAHLSALRLLGKITEGTEAARQAVVHARAIGYPPLLASALEKLAWFELSLGHDDDALDDGYAAARAAAIAHDDATVASALSGVSHILGNSKHDFAAAEVAYQSAVTAAARASNPGAILEHVYGDRESLLYERGDYPMMMAFSQLAYALSVHLHGVASYQAAISLGELADATRQLGYPNPADAMFRRALATAEAALSPDHPYVLAILNNAGRNRLEVGDYDGAALFFERAREGKEKIYAPDHASIALTAHNLAIARSGQRRLPEARALLERAISIRLARLGPGHPLLATSYAELARVERLQGRSGEALENFDRAIAIQRQVYGEAHASLADTVRLKTDLLLHLGQLDEAKAALAEVHEIDGRRGVGPSQDADALRLDAELFVRSKRPRDALPLYRQALKLDEAAYGATGPGIVGALLGLGAAELEANEVAAALATAERAVVVGTANAAPVDVQTDAQFLLARARWAAGIDRPGARALARASRARLAALPYPAEALPAIDRWLARHPR